MRTTPLRALFAPLAALLALPVALPLASCSEEAVNPCEEDVCNGRFRLSAPVEIVRDEDGVVHIYGETNADVFYASGYMQAVDRLYQMDLMRRQVYGRRAEVLGEDYAGDDAFIRQLNVIPWGLENARFAREEAPERYAIVEAWAAGVNARVAEVLAGEAPMPLGFVELGFEPEPWIAQDAFVIGKTILFENGNQLERDILASLIFKYSPDVFVALPFSAPLLDEFILDPAAIPPAKPPHPHPGQTRSEGRQQTPGGARERQKSERLPELPTDAREKLLAMQQRLARYRPGASNNWAVGPELTDNGKSMICGDPHQPLRSPPLVWMHHMNSADGAGTIDQAGWSFVGTPGISLGHSRYLAWTATTNYPDVTDVWNVEVVDDSAMVGGQAVKLVVREETIAVRDADPITVLVEEVPGYGVLLPADLVPLPLGNAGDRLLFNWTGYQATKEFLAFFELGQAKNVEEFDAAVDEMELGSFNFIAASASETTYRSSPSVPFRGDPAEHPPAYVVLDGSDPDTLWTGELLTLDQMPSKRGAPDGFLVSANNDPFGFTRDGDLTNDPYYFGAYFDPGTRAARARFRLEELAAAGPITVDDMKALQLDAHSLMADELVPQIVEVWARVPTDDALAAYRERPELDALVTLLASWDRRMTRDQAAPVAFEAVLNFFVRNAVADDMGLFFEPVEDSSSTYAIKLGLLAARGDAELLQEGRDELLLRALSETATLLQERYGAVDSGFTWADYHVTVLRSESIPELFGGDWPTDGAEGTVNVSEASFFDGDVAAMQHRSSGGAMYRMTATFDEDDRPRAFYTLAGGNTGEPGGKHYGDLTSDWVEGNYRLLRFARADVDAGAAETLRLDP